LMAFLQRTPGTDSNIRADGARSVPKTTASGLKTRLLFELPVNGAPSSFKCAARFSSFSGRDESDLVPDTAFSDSKSETCTFNALATRINHSSLGRVGFLLDSITPSLDCGVPAFCARSVWLSPALSR